MPRRLISSSFGVVPAYAQFSRDIRRVDDDGNPYWRKNEPYRVELTGHDAELLADYGNFTQRSAAYSHKLGGQLNERQMYGFVKFLVRKFERGDEEAGSLASGIMQTLGYEWI